MREDINETFLADWLAGNLTDNQLRDKVSAEDFDAYLKLRQSIDSLQLQSPDLEANYAAIKEKKIALLDDARPSRVISFQRALAAAAAIIVLIGLYNVFVFSNQVQSGVGESSSIALTDNSLVQLNADSKISYPGFFAINRKIKLEGEAFFEVSKGRKFTVKTAMGDVTVLGTKFNVLARDGIFEVVCHEGKVKVCVDNSETVLNRGDAFRLYSNAVETWKITPSEHPTWEKHESGFYKMPMEYVIEAFENQYNAKVDYPEMLKSTRFTGTFTHENLETALQSICIPMNLKYAKTNGKIVISE